MWTFRLYTSETNLLNNIRNNSTNSATLRDESLQGNSRINSSRGTISDIESDQACVNKQEETPTQKILYMGIGVATVILGALSLFSKKFGKFIKNIFVECQKLLMNHNSSEFKKTQFSAVSIPDKKPLDVEVLDTNFLRKNSLLRRIMRPEIEDIEFEEIIK